MQLVLVPPASTRHPEAAMFVALPLSASCLVVQKFSNPDGGKRPPSLDAADNVTVGARSEDEGWWDLKAPGVSYTMHRLSRRTFWRGLAAAVAVLPLFLKPPTTKKLKEKQMINQSFIHSCGGVVAEQKICERNCCVADCERVLSIHLHSPCPSQPDCTSDGLSGERLSIYLCIYLSLTLDKTRPVQLKGS